MNYTEEQSRVIRSVPPGVTGIGSLILRDEERYYAHRLDAKDFYIGVISPYKASLELWYIENRSVSLNFTILALTVVALVAPSLDVTRFFNGLPAMPREMVGLRFTG